MDFTGRLKIAFSLTFLVLFSSQSLLAGGAAPVTMEVTLQGFEKEALRKIREDRLKELNSRRSQIGVQVGPNFLGKVVRENADTTGLPNPQSAGIGCPEGSYTLQLTEDQSAILVSFSQFNLETQTRDELKADQPPQPERPIRPPNLNDRPPIPIPVPGLPGRIKLPIPGNPPIGGDGHNRRPDPGLLPFQQIKLSTCALSVPLNIPAGKRLKISYIDFSGFVLLSGQTGASFRSSVSFVDPRLKSPRGFPIPIMLRPGQINERLNFKFDFNGPREETYSMTTSQDIGKDSIYSACGKTTNLFIASHLILATNDQENKSFATVDSVTGGIAKVLKPELADEIKKSPLNGMYYIDWEDCQ